MSSEKTKTLRSTLWGLMSKFKIFRILRSKFRNKDLITEEWYLERKKACNSCEYNSKNKKSLSSFKEKIFYYLNMKEPFCTICSCEIKAKASEELEQCSLGLIGKERKWNKYLGD